MVTVKITQTAYETLLIHLLQYGNKSLKKTNEVMGLLFGVRSGEIVEIRKIVPIKHGPDCEKAFTETDLITFGELEKKIMQENVGLEPYGFYTSHPKMGFYLSQNEIKNLVYFIQEKKNTNAIAIIGDHIQLEQVNNFGIKAFQLKDPSKGTNSDFLMLDIEIESPQGLSIFKTTKYLIEQAQKRQLYIEEQGSQLAADDSLWNDAFGDKEDEQAKLMKKIDPLLKGLQPEIANINDSFITAGLKTYLEFMENITQFAGKSYSDPSSDLIALRENFDYGMGNTTAWFETTFKKHAEKILEEYKRTFMTVDDSITEYSKVLKKLLIAMKSDYQKLL